MDDIINSMKERKNEKQNSDINLSLGEKPKREHRRRQLAPENGLGIIDAELKNQDMNDNKKELDKNFLQRPQKERKKKTRENIKKKSENSLNSNTSSEDLQAPKPKVTERVLSNEDNDIMIIPDIEEEEKNEMLTTVAAPPQIKVNRIPTMRELENEFFNSSEERLNEVYLGIDLSFLSNNSLCYPDQIMEEDKHWDWDLLFVEVASEIQNDLEKDNGYLNKLDFTPGHGLIKGVGSTLDFERFKVSKNDD